MNTSRFTDSELASSSRRLLIATFILVLAVSGFTLWTGVSAHSLKLSSGSAAATDTVITTIAGGGFGSNVQARQAPMVLPTGVALDPMGRGFYVIDEVDGSSLLRFVNTTASAVTLAGVAIQPNSINLIAGGGTQTNDGIPPRDADLAEITGVAIEPSGSLLYLTIPAYSAIRVINVGTQSATVYGKTIAPATINTISMPDLADFRALTIHPATRELYFSSGRLVFKLDASGNRTVVAGGGSGSSGGDGGPANKARLVTPIGLAFDNNNNLLIADGGDARDVAGIVRKVNSSGIISSLATDLEYPTGITTAANGDAYAALGNAQQVIRITPAGVKTVVAGNSSMLLCDTGATPACGDNGPATQASLSIPDSTASKTLILAVDAKGLFIPDFRFKRVRYVNLSNAPVSIAGTNIAPQQINTVAGNGLPSPYDGTPATSAELFVPTGAAVDALGNLFISDTGNNRLRFVNRTSAPVTLFLTTPFATTVQPGQIVTLNREVGDPQMDDRVTTATFLTPQGLAATPNGVLIVDSQAGALIKIPPTSVTGRRSGVIRFLNTSNADVTFFPNGGDAKVVIPPGHVKDIAGVRPPTNPQTLGDGLSANKVAFFPTDIAVDRAGNLYIADQGNNRIRQIEAQTGIVSTVYGDGNTQTLSGPTGIAFDGSGRLHIADTRNNRIIRQVAAGGGAFSVIADSAININRPRDLTVDNTGKIFITNAGTHQILDLEAAGAGLGRTSVVAGTGSAGFSGDEGAGAQARLNLPNPGTATNDVQVTANIITLSNGDMIFADTVNNRIRHLKLRSSTPPISSVSAASFAGTELAGESIVAAFGDKLSTGVQTATSIPLPTTLAGTSVKIRDSLGAERSAPLFFAAPSQINLQIPAGTVNGPATIIVTSGDSTVSTGTMNITTIAPGLFTANASGQDVAAAVALRLKSDGTQIYEPVARFDSGQNKFVPAPIDLGASSDQMFLILYGTGFRYRSSLTAVTATVGGTSVEMLYAGPVDGFVGLDQSNIRIPRTLAGRGVVDVILTVDGRPANAVTIQIK
ncbi:MAG: hypothetical protein JMDDDDMK_04929 [Acidobacteria bacterium]|nr:hypothetical protein [Acidobacteriota bacterium]